MGVVSSTGLAWTLSQLSGFFIQKYISVLKAFVLALDADIFSVLQFVKIALKLSLADTHCCCDSSLFRKAASLLPGVHQQKGVGHAGANRKIGIAHNQVWKGGKTGSQHLILDDDALHAFFGDIPYFVHNSFSQAFYVLLCQEIHPR